jgi:hypothetical protein
MASSVDVNGQASNGLSSNEPIQRSGIPELDRRFNRTLNPNRRPSFASGSRAGAERGLMHMHWFPTDLIPIATSQQSDGNFLLLRPYHGEHGPKVPVTPEYIVLQRVLRKRECMSILRS